MRFLIQALNISGTEHEKEMVRALRKICHDSPLNASIFHPYFVFFDQVNKTLLFQSIIIIISITILNIPIIIYLLFSV